MRPAAPRSRKSKGNVGAIARGTLDITRITPPLECWDDALTTGTAFELVSGLSLFCVMPGIHQQDVSDPVAHGR